MEKQEISVATICCAREPAEEQLLRAALRVLAQLNLPVFITDGGSNQNFIDFLKSFPHFTVLQPDGKGVWAQATKSIQAASQSGSRFILYTEPDKLDFFQNNLEAFLTEAPVTDQTGVVLASRSANGFATFPVFQQTTETAINQCCAELIGQPVDYTYGPFLFNRELAPYLNLIQEDIGWGWRPYVFGMAHRLGYQAVPFIADFNCPADQREDTKTERIYRMKQLYQNIQGLVLSATVPVHQ